MFDGDFRFGFEFSVCVVVVLAFLPTPVLLFGVLARFFLVPSVSKFVTVDGGFFRTACFVAPCLPNNRSTSLNCLSPQLPLKFHIQHE